MDNIVDILVRITRKCERVATPFDDGPLKEMTERLVNACIEIGLSWSGSNIGYQAWVYLDGFRKPKPGEIFDPQGQWDRYFAQESRHWRETDYETVRQAIMTRAKVSDLEPIANAARRASRTFEEAKDELLPRLDALLRGQEDKAIREQRDALAALPTCVSREDVARHYLPRQFITGNMLALSQGVRPAHHIVFLGWLTEQCSYGNQAREIGKIARYTARYMEHRMSMKGKSIAKTDGPIFIGHGGWTEWKELKEFIRERLGLEYEEFNRESVAGLTPKERLTAMLDKACFAFLVMTAEDEHADGTRHARENVIHEIGLFQGRLSFERAIILLEEGCKEFTNIDGLQQIRFVKGKLKACFEDIRQVLEREGIIK
jgi:predicted nucleotide-binding protein